MPSIDKNTQKNSKDKTEKEISFNEFVKALLAVPHKKKKKGKQSKKKK